VAFSWSTKIVVVLVVLLLSNSASATIGKKGPETTTLSSGLIGEYHMDEVSGNLVDYSNNGNTLVARGSKFTYLQPGTFGYAILTDRSGSTQGFFNNTLTTSNSMSICGWYNPKENTTVGSYYSYGFMLGNGSVNQSVYFGDNWDTFSYGNFQCSANLAPAKIGIWSHICIVISSTSISAYVNGTAYSSTTCNTTLPATARFSLTSHISGWFGFNGTTDEVRVYNRTITQVEAQDLYSFTSPIAGWHFDEVTGNAVDYSGNGYNGTNTITNITYNTNGVYGKGIVYNSNYSRTTISNGLATSLSNQNFTLNMWMKPFSQASAFPIPLDIGSQSESRGLLVFIPKYGGQLIAELELMNSSGDRVSYAVTSPLIHYDTWNMVTFAYSNPIVSIYINGTLAGSGDFSRLNNASMTGNTPVVIGDYYYPDIDKYNGSIDELTMWNRQLSSSELQNLFEAGITQSTYTTTQTVYEESTYMQFSGIVGFADNSTTNVTTIGPSGAAHTIMNSSGIFNTSTEGVTRINNTHWSVSTNYTIPVSSQENYIVVLYACGGSDLISCSTSSVAVSVTRQLTCKTDWDYCMFDTRNQLDYLNGVNYTLSNQLMGVTEALFVYFPGWYSTSQNIIPWYNNDHTYYMKKDGSNVYVNLSDSACSYMLSSDPNPLIVHVKCSGGVGTFPDNIVKICLNGSGTYSHNPYAPDGVPYSTVYDFASHASQYYYRNWTLREETTNYPVDLAAHDVNIYAYCSSVGGFSYNMSQRGGNNNIIIQTTEKPHYVLTYDDNPPRVRDDVEKQLKDIYYVSSAASTKYTFLLADYSGGQHQGDTLYIQKSISGAWDNIYVYDFPTDNYVYVGLVNNTQYKLVLKNEIQTVDMGFFWPNGVDTSKTISVNVPYVSDKVTWYKDVQVGWTQDFATGQVGAVVTTPLNISSTFEVYDASANTYVKLYGATSTGSTVYAYSLTDKTKPVYIDLIVDHPDGQKKRDKLVLLYNESSPLNNSAFSAPLPTEMLGSSTSSLKKMFVLIFCWFIFLIACKASDYGTGALLATIWYSFFWYVAWIPQTEVPFWFIALMGTVAASMKIFEHRYN
jgi:hypothetical protein